MSDVGALSYEYQQASDLARKLEKLLAQVDQGHPEQDVRLNVALALDGLIGLLAPLSEESDHGEAAMRTPVGLVRRLRHEQFNGLPYAVALDTLKRRLCDPGEELEDADVQLLRDLVGATEYEVAATFRRMVRR